MPVRLFEEDELDLWPMCKEEWITWCGQTAYISKCCLAGVRWVESRTGSSIGYVPGSLNTLCCDGCKMSIKHACQLHKIDQFIQS